jgi:hypothetical protein
MSLALDWMLPRGRPTVPEVGSRAVLHFRDGSELVVDVDVENGSSLRDSFEPRIFWFQRGNRNKRDFAWFETINGFLIGVDLAFVSAIEWLPAGIAAPAATPIDRDHLVLRFRDRPALRLSQVFWDDIARLRGATIGKRRGDPFKLTACFGPRVASIVTGTLTLATLPAAWMDVDPPAGE